MSRYFTVNEIASELGLSTRTVYRMLEGGLLKGYKTGRVWRVSRNDMAEYLAEKSNQDTLVAFGAAPPVLTAQARTFQELAYPLPNSKRIANYRILLERQMASGEIEHFELPLTVEEQSASYIIQLRVEPSVRLELPKPRKTRTAAFYFLQSDPELWAKVKQYFTGNDRHEDWVAAFMLEKLDNNEKIALQWAYNLEDATSRPFVEGAGVADRLSLLGKLNPAQRRAALISLELLYSDVNNA